MKKDEFVTKNPDEFTVGLVNAIHDYIDEHGLPDALKEDTMIEVAHAILSDYDFKVTTSEQASFSSFLPPQTRYCNDKAMAALIHGAKMIKDDYKGFTIRVEPNPYSMGVTKPKAVPVSEPKKPATQRKPGVRSNQKGYQKNGRKDKSAD